MSFVVPLALAAALLVVAPWLAHRLRRRRAQEQPFPPARLVPPAPPQARRRSRLEDRALLATRVVAVLLLAALGATPLVRCSRLSLQRTSGASVAIAIVLDDSMSMRAPSPDAGKSRFQRAREGARELVASARDGDAIGIVLAGAPSRVALAATTDLAAARTSIDALTESDRATDLDGAIVLARGLVASLPQADRRIVVLSDLADGRPAAPIDEGGPVPVWIALPELAQASGDCAVMRADRRGARVRVGIACGPNASAAGREVVVEDDTGKPVAHATAAAGSEVETSVLLASEGAKASSRARLAGGDAIASDDVAPILEEARRGSIAVVTDATEESVATGGGPILEQALAALDLGIDVRPIPAVPDRAEDVTVHLGIVIDDPPGLTPEQRHALAAFLDGGGVAMIALGPRAGSAPLGATLEPILAHPPGWSDTRASGADPKSAVGELAQSADGFADLSAHKRAVLSADDASAFERILAWNDGAPLVARRAMARGEAWIVTLPFSVEASDLALRPGFLGLVDAFVRAARGRVAAARSGVGTPWTFPGAHAVQVQGPGGAIAVSRESGLPRAVPPLVGSYKVTIDGKTETRVAAPDAREIDLRPRVASPGARGERLGERRASVDVSPQLALVLLALVVVEMALRAWTRRRAEAA